MKKTKIIYIDIDGVLNNSHFYHIISHYTWDLFDQKCVHLLNELVKKNNAKMILISDWRKTYGLQTVKKVFKKNRVIGDIAGAIDSSLTKEEGIIKSIKTISETLENFRFVILDDEYFDLPNSVKINPEYGFDFNDYKKANLILNHIENEK